MGGVGAEPVVGGKVGEHHRPDVPQGHRLRAGADRQLEREFLEQPGVGQVAQADGVGLRAEPGVDCRHQRRDERPGVEIPGGADPRRVDGGTQRGVEGGVVEAGPFQDLVDQRAEAGTAGQVGHRERQRRSRRLLVGDLGLVGPHQLVGGVGWSRQRVLRGQRAERDPAPLVVEMAGESRAVQCDRLAAGRLVCLDRRRLRSVTSSMVPSLSTGSHAGSRPPAVTRPVSVFSDAPGRPRATTPPGGARPG